MITCKTCKRQFLNNFEFNEHVHECTKDDPEPLRGESFDDWRRRCDEARAAANCGMVLP